MYSEEYSDWPLKEQSLPSLERLAVAGSSHVWRFSSTQACCQSSRPCSKHIDSTCIDLQSLLEHILCISWELLWPLVLSYPWPMGVCISQDVSFYTYPLSHPLYTLLLTLSPWQAWRPVDRFLIEHRRHRATWISDLNILTKAQLTW